MTNLSVLSIPVATPPVTPPPAGQVYVYSNPDNEIQIMASDGKIDSGQSRKYTTEVQFSEAISIISVLSAEITLAGDVTAKVRANSIIMLSGSTNGTNDGIKVVSSTVLESGNTRVTVAPGSLQTGLLENGQIYIAKEVEVNHNLGTKHLVFSIISEAGESVQASTIVDENKLLIKPDTPILGNFSVTIIA